MYGLSFEPHDIDISQEIIRAVSSKVVPFRVSTASVEVVDDITSRRVRVEVSTYPDDVFEMELDVMTLFVDDMFELARIIGERAGAYFASIYTVPEGNVILGEN